MKKAYMLNNGSFVIEGHADYDRLMANAPFALQVDETSVKVHEGPVEDWMTK